MNANRTSQRQYMETFSWATDSAHNKPREIALQLNAALSALLAAGAVDMEIKWCETTQNFIVTGWRPHEHNV